MKVLITGSNGFIGSRVAAKCIEEKCEVYGIDLAEKPADRRIQAYGKCDLAGGQIGELLEQAAPDVIVHCAGSADVGFSVRCPQEDFRRNVAATHNLLFTMQRLKMRDTRVLLLSSAGVYGNPERLPIRETDAANPISPYAVHKKMVEDMGLYFVRQCGFDVQILRVFSAYGPGLKKQLFWDMYQKIQKTGRLELYGTGQESRDYIYIDDLVDVIYRIMMKPGKGHLIYNVANGREIRIADAARIFVNAMGLDESIIAFNRCVREGDPLNWKADIARLQEIGFCAGIGIQEGISRYVEWCRTELG